MKWADQKTGAGIWTCRTGGESGGGGKGAKTENLKRKGLECRKMNYFKGGISKVFIGKI